MSDSPRIGARRLAVNYGARLILAHLTAAAVVLLMIVSLSYNTVGDARQLLIAKNLLAFIVVVGFAATADVVVGILNLRPTFRWFASGAEPTAAQERAAVRLPARQTAIEFAVWIVAGAVFMALNLDAPGGVAYVIGVAMFFGGVTTACVGYLLTAHRLRPILAAAMKNARVKIQIPGALARLIFVWVLFSVVPSVGIAVIVVARHKGWFLQKSVSVELPILVFAAASVILGFAATLLVARSISDPIREVVVGMSQLENGCTDTSVAVYESSEIGRLQSGFNDMVVGLAERERLRDLFGRYVGADVARRALESDVALRGDVRTVGVLYVDLAGSTTLAATRPPDEVAEILNIFFRIVVATVEDSYGLINKFEGDAVLAVFGAPLRLDDPATAPLATARRLAPQLRRLAGVDFGIGVSCGSVFAGTIGAENRYEYTVVGDPVNEAARLADHAKDYNSRVLASGVAIAGAQPSEQRRWSVRGSTLLRGRTTPTEIGEPAADIGDSV